MQVVPPAKPASKPRRRPKSPAHLTPEEVERFFAYCKDVRDAAIFRVMYHRGLRASEIGILQLADWNQASGRLQVHRLKGSYSLDYQIKPVEVKALRAWLRVRGKAPGPLFPSRLKRKKGITRWPIFRLMRHYCALAGIPLEKRIRMRGNTPAGRAMRSREPICSTSRNCWDMPMCRTQ